MDDQNRVMRIRLPKPSPATWVRLGIVITGFTLGTVMRFVVPSSWDAEQLPAVESPTPQPLSPEMFPTPIEEREEEVAEKSESRSESSDD